MNWVFISIYVVTAAQAVICGFGPAMFISCIGRCLFLMRSCVSVVPIKVSIWFEAAHLFFTLLGVVFSKNGIDIIDVLLSVLFGLAVCLLYIIDDQFYLYTVVDDDDDDEEESVYNK